MQIITSRPFGNTIQKTVYRPLGCLKSPNDITKCLKMTPDEIWKFINYKKYEKHLNAKLTDIPELVLEDTDPYLVRRTSDGLFLFRLLDDFGLTYYTITRIETIDEP